MLDSVSDASYYGHDWASLSSRRVLFSYGEGDCCTTECTTDAEFTPAVLEGGRSFHAPLSMTSSMALIASVEGLKGHGESSSLGELIGIIGLGQGAVALMGTALAVVLLILIIGAQLPAIGSGATWRARRR